MFAIDAPLWLLLLGIIPLLYWFRLRRKDRGGTIKVAFGSWNGEAFKAPPGVQKGLLPLVSAMHWVALALLIVALAQPVVLGQKKVFLNQGKEIIFLMDLSPSMAAQDVPDVSRLTLIKETIKEFIQQRQNDGIGLVGFATEAALYSPVTVDHGAVLAAMDRMDVMDLGDGTSIGLGLAVAALHLSPDRTREKVLILVSDGDNNAGEVDTKTAIEVLNAMGVRIHVLGVGADRDVYLEFTVPQTGRVFRGTYQSVLDEESLMAIAEKGGGRYFHGVSEESLTLALDTVSSIEISDTKLRFEITRTSVASFLLVLAMVLLLLEQLTRRLYFREVS